MSLCQIEIDMSFGDLKPEEKLHIAPLRILSFDIECYNPEGKALALLHLTWQPGLPQSREQPGDSDCSLLEGVHNVNQS